MVTIRRLETAIGNLYKEKLIRGFCHLYSGQEACAVGMKAVMRPMDSIIASYRIHGWTYLMGGAAFEVISELTGKRTGTSRGKGGSMHMFGKNFYGGNGIVGAQVPIGTGIALADQYLKTGGVCFTLYGDGAANQGQVYEAFNMAKLWSLPCVFVCENNGYAMGTSVERSSASTEYYARGDYIPGMRVDGMDVLAVREASAFAIDHCTSGKGPIIMELATYRYSGHSMSDPGTTYRTRDEVQIIRQSRDPISLFKEKISDSLVSEVELKAIDSDVKEEISKALSKAKAEVEVGPEELTADVYSTCFEPKIRNISPWKPLKHINVSR